MRQKKAFLYAYDHVNLGDDLFIRTIAKRYPKTQFFMWSDQRNRENFQDVENLKIITPQDKKIQMLTKVRSSLVIRYQENLKHKCDAVIYIGGSIFMEYPTWKNIVNWWEYQAEHHKFYALGANFGPYQTEAYRDAMNRMFEHLQDVCFRDQYSYQLFEGNPKVRVAPDILFSLAEEGEKIRKKEIMFSMIHCKKKDEGESKLAPYHDAYIRYIGSLAKQYMQQGYKIIYTSFCEDEGDGEAIQELLKQMDASEKAHCEVLTYNGKNSAEILKKMKEAESIVATRFHAMILGIAFGTPVLPILYSDKTKNVLKDIGFDGDCVDLRCLSDNQATVLPKQFAFEKVQILKRDASKHFEILNQSIS